MQYIYSRDELGLFLLNVADQTIQRIPDTRNTFKGRFPWFESINEFLLSDKDQSVIPLWCEKIQEKGKRYAAHILTGYENYIFWNVEKIGGKWEPNHIQQIDAQKAYFGFFKKVKCSDNDCMILSVVEMRGNKQIK